jgi:eukaryotic-like serine/threonine-protein kinase
MTEPHDPNQTVDVPAAEPADSLEAGLAAGFGRPMAPRSSLGDLRPVLLKDAEGESAHIVKPKSDAMPPKDQTGDRYQLSGEIARGGMGAVLRGRDVDLGRDLAVKVLLEKHANRPEVARRFIEEAQIGGQLQHPGVVPVYDIGRFGNRPFFTMKLVKGETLAHLLAEREQPTDDRPRLLGIALKVSETLAYAHAKGVIHRDLKPANIMVGAFGEVQVMDWGLAKVLAEGGIADEERASRAHREPEEGTQIRTARSTGSEGSFGSETEAGSLLGTPAYMPPEQANGDVAHLDRRADVFGLGAILCEMLTGKPPYMGRSGEEVRRKAANGDLADATARIDACGADVELIALTKQCLSPEAIDRPKDAQEVTDGLSAYLNGVQERLQTAERERAVAMVREAEQRRKRRWQLLAASSAAVIALLVGGGLWWQDRQATAKRIDDQIQAAKATALEGAARGALDEAEQFLRDGQATLASAALSKADALQTGGDSTDLQSRTADLRRDLDMLARLQDVRIAAEGINITGTKEDQAELAKGYAEAFRAYGIDLAASASADAATGIAARPIRRDLVAALIQWSDSELDKERSAALAKVIDAADPLKLEGPYAQFLAADKSSDADAMATAAEAINLRNVPPTRIIATASKLYRVGKREVAQRVLARGSSAYPTDFPLALANALYLRNSPVDLERAAAVAYGRVSVALRPDDAGAWNYLGFAQSGANLNLEAEDSLRRALTLRPRSPLLHNNIGVVLSKQNKIDDSEKAYRQAIELALGSKYVMPYINLAAHFTDGNVNRFAEAEPLYKTALEIAPTDTDAITLLAQLYEKQVRSDDLMTFYRIVADRKGVSGSAFITFALIFSRTKQLPLAEEAARRAVELLPKSATAIRRLAVVLGDQGKLDEAAERFRAALVVSTSAERDQTRIELVLMLSKAGRVSEAIREYAEYAAGDVVSGDGFKYAQLIEVATAFQKAGQIQESITALLAELAAHPERHRLRLLIGAAQYVSGDLDAASATLRKTVELSRPLAVNAGYALGRLYIDAGKLDEAVATWSQIARLNPSDPDVFFRLADAYRYQGRFTEAAAAYQQVLKLNPDAGSVQGDISSQAGAAARLIEMFLETGQWQAAVAAEDARKGKGLPGRFPMSTYRPFAARLEAVIAGTDKPKDAAERYRFGQMACFHLRYTDAARLFEVALAENSKVHTANYYRPHPAAAAARASTGQGKNPASEGQWPELRAHALTWLRGDLEKHKAVIARSEQGRLNAHRALRLWLDLEDFQAVREPAALAKLPEAEHKEWEAFWAEVRELLQNSESKPTKGDKK